MRMLFLEAFLWIWGFVNCYGKVQLYFIYVVPRTTFLFDLKKNNTQGSLFFQKNKWGINPIIVSDMTHFPHGAWIDSYTNIRV